MTNNTWNDFVKNIDFGKINNIKKQVKDKNLDEGLSVFKFLTSFRDSLPNIIPSLSNYKKGKNSHPTQPQWSKDNGFRVGFYYGDKNYMPATQLNITIGADWGGGVFIKDNKNLIFGNQNLLKKLKEKYPKFDFNENKKHVFGIMFKNENTNFPLETEVIDTINSFSKIFETMIKVERMENKIKLLEHQKQIILQGPPGTGKTRLAKQMARYIINSETDAKIDDLGDQVKLIQFHPSYSYEDFVRGIVAKSTGNKIEYKTEDKVLAQMANDAKKALGDEYYKSDTTDVRKSEILKDSKKYILIIDEINRANLSSVLGELIYALEYRDEAVESMYDIDDGDRKITLPSNLYIIGTMNTADRSIGHIDYAIRRRFTFVDVLPDETIVSENSKFKEVEKMFDEPKYDGCLSPEFQKDKVMLGHSYFIADSNEELNNKLNYQVIPLLKEYVSDGVLLESANDEIKKLETDESTS